MRVTVVQTNSGPDKARNLAQARDLIEAAVAEDRPDLVALPEVFAFQGGTAEQRRAAAETLPGGEAWTLLQRLARRHAVFLHGGSFLERDGDALYNTTVAFDRDGREIARYRKIHRFDVVTPDGREYRESALVGRGAELVTYEAEGVTVGCSICYDVRFGELYRGLVAMGAQLLMVPAAFTLQTGKDHWEPLLRARAIECQCYVAAPAQVGSFQAAGDVRQNWGHSMIVDPWGHLLAQCADRPGFATARLDLDHLARVRRSLPSLTHRVLPG
ncbi:MAG TPA: carbon-nitrogen hydrolase family protein [Geminicoccaceae bacterium]|nr:carbon-nitrogen hydrolase family protein [Geminicoccaceae bacterium]